MEASVQKSILFLAGAVLLGLPLAFVGVSSADAG
jgi:hypothetical protein